MTDPELRILRLYSPLTYVRLTAGGDGAPFDPRPGAADGEEQAALYSQETAVRFDPLEGPRAPHQLPPPLERGAGPPPAGRPLETLELAPGNYGFLQNSASTEAEWLGLLEAFARQAWWEGLNCEGPYILRRVWEDGRWAAQVWRRLSDTSPAGRPSAGCPSPIS